ncbi:Uncharacterised protein [Legionella steigerwaltii]|uniref:Uncharacterized protein n=1 Tax=Legionella steigerwaltii TaxID=460 RepID=A0A378L5W9_9GAMM|nr:hypothetical protein [Legionella steigerwaltii]KTD72057.1 hypothetical protein Lstg_2675 [Legionella steigerwaltii]STY22465.1 Uncharacterised protein [Legionella steigerwaltii]
MLLITTFAICWPAAVALTVLYVGYEMYHAYNQHQSKKEAAQHALEAPENDDEEFDRVYCLA